MKSSYELAMERLNKSAPVEKLNPAQKKELAGLHDRYQAKIAEREIFLKDKIGEAMGKGAYEEVEQLEKQLNSERRALTGELEEKKDAIRQRR